MRDKSGWGVYASVSCSLVLNVPELTEEVNNVLGGCAGGVHVRVPALTTRNKTAHENCLAVSYETRASEVTQLPAMLLQPRKIYKDPFRYS